MIRWIRCSRARQLAAAARSRLMTFPGAERRRPDAVGPGTEEAALGPRCGPRAHICNRSEALGEFLPRCVPPRTPTCRIGSLETVSCLPLFFLPTSPELLTSHRQPGSWGKGGETACVGPGRPQGSGLIVLSDGFHHTSTPHIGCGRLRIINSSLR